MAIRKSLFLIHNLENNKLQIIGLICRPKDGMIGCLGAVFYLAQSLDGTLEAASRMVLVNSSGSMKWEQEQVAR